MIYETTRIVIVFVTFRVISWIVFELHLRGARLEGLGTLTALFALDSMESYDAAIAHLMENNFRRGSRR